MTLLSLADATPRAMDEHGRLLHRSTWEHHFGAIPRGWEVHHCDQDKHNNDISNLVALPAKLHRAVHDALDNGASRPRADLLLQYHRHKLRYDKLVERQRRTERELEYYSATDVWSRKRQFRVI